MMRGRQSWGWRLATGLVIGILTGCDLDGDAASGPSTETFTNIARAIARGEDRFTAGDVANWIIEGRKDFMLVDIRPAEEFASGHIETASSIPLLELTGTSSVAGLPRDRRIILYSNGTENAAQAVVMLRLAGLDAYSLLGGYNFWTQYTLDPKAAGEADEELLELRKRRVTAWYFSGEYQPASGLPLSSGQTAPSQGFTPELEAVQSAEQAAESEETDELEEMELIVEEGC